MTLLDIPAPPVAVGGLPRLLPESGDASLAAHLDRLGPLPPAHPGLVGVIAAAGLRGRGGAAFPTSRKMAAVAAASGPKVVVANGTEGEPLSHKDRTLLATNPHLVLDGIVAAATAVGAGRALLCVKQDQPSLVRELQRALSERGAELPIELAETPDRYVAGQESALVQFLNGGEARPVFGPRPSERGVDRRPTLVDNVETLAQVGLIARFGATWWREVGTREDPGTALVTVSGGVARPGVYEIPIGYGVTDLLDHVGAEATGALLVGGYFGRWVDPRHLGGASLSDAGLAPYGASFGCGVIVAVPERSCAWAEVAAVAGWFAANSAGQCGPCVFGLADIAVAAQGVLEGQQGAEAAARRWTAMVRGRGACQLPDGAAMFVDSALDVLADEVAAHRHGGCGRPDGGHLPAPWSGDRR